MLTPASFPRAATDEPEAAAVSGEPESGKGGQKKRGSGGAAGEGGQPHQGRKGGCAYVQYVNADCKPNLFASLCLTGFHGVKPSVFELELELQSSKLGGTQMVVQRCSGQDLAPCGLVRAGLEFLTSLFELPDTRNKRLSDRCWKKHWRADYFSNPLVALARRNGNNEEVWAPPVPYFRFVLPLSFYLSF